MTATRTRKPSAPAVDTTPEAPAEVTPAQAPQPNLCRCGCGQPTVRTDARYVSGHDARHAGEVGRNGTEDEIHAMFAEQPKLLAKALGVRATKIRKAAEKEAKQVARKAAADAAKQVLASAGF